jgi:hypothetical protein
MEALTKIRDIILTFEGHPDPSEGHTLRTKPVPNFFGDF